MQGRIALWLAALALLVGATPADGAINGSPRSAKAAAAFNAPLPPGDITVYRDWCDGDQEADLDACAAPSIGVIWLKDFDRWVLAHEIGHFFDVRVLGARCVDVARMCSTWARRQLTRLLGFKPGTPWLGDYATGEDCFKVACPNEHFADAYALCATWGVPLVRRTRGGALQGHDIVGYGYNPTPREHRRICGLINRRGAAALAAQTS